MDVISQMTLDILTLDPIRILIAGMLFIFCVVLPWRFLMGQRHPLSPIGIPFHPKNKYVLTVFVADRNGDINASGRDYESIDVHNLSAQEQASITTTDVDSTYLMNALPSWGAFVASPAIANSRAASALESRWHKHGTEANTWCKAKCVLQIMRNPFTPGYATDIATGQD